jgi:beta-N-acetylhexosaminidase
MVRFKREKEEMDHDQEQEKRENRRRRRIRNQIGAYVTMLVGIGVMAVLVIFGINWLNQHQTQDLEAKQEEVLESMFASEETLPMPEPPQETLPTDTIQEPSPEEQLEQIIADAIGTMPLEDKVAGLFFVTPESITGVSTAIKAGEGTQEALGKYGVGGIIYSAKNMKTNEQLTEMIANTVTYTRYPLFFGIDEEGGTVSRLTSSGLAQGVDAAAKIGATNDPENAYQAGLTTGGNLLPMGFNVDFAPVADIANIDKSVMADRSYGADATVVTPYVLGMLRGLSEKGITGCLKHFPGIGATTADTHEGVSTSERTAEEFRSQEFTVFQAGIEAGAKMVMVGHIAAPSLTGDNMPCSLSEVVVTQILRQELDFEGVIITDAMDMGAISTYYDSGEAAIMALKAGCDMVLMPEDFEKAYRAVLQAVSDGTISEERVNDSLKRIYRIKYAGMVTE